MTRRDTRWLLAGILSGLVIAAIFVWTVYQRTGANTPAPQHAEAAADVAEPAVVADSAASVASVQLSDEEQKQIGIETTEVKRQAIRKKIVAPGKVAEPETGIGTISARIGGRIERLLINITGETVSREQPVALIYSPEVFTAAEEYRLALENRQRLNASKEAQAINDADQLVRASRRRLELWGLGARQVDEIAASPEKTVQITTFSPVAGVVTKRNVAEGQYVKEGDVLFEVAGLSTVWVQADIFESDIPLVRAGQRVKISAPTLAGGSVQGTVHFLQPSVDPQNRTMSARIEVPNPQMRLRPGMFVQVVMEAPVGTDVIAVPRSAVLDTGRERVVYVAEGNGVFEKRSIEADLVGDDDYAATRGIAPGERVVTHGSFLIDSQTRLTGTITGMYSGSKAYDNGSNYAVTLRSEPDPPKGGSEATFHVKVAGQDGRPVDDAQVQATLVMPAMPSMGMPEIRSITDLKWNGSEYIGKDNFAMAGSWNITVEARRSGQLLGVYRSRFEAR